MNNLIHRIRNTPPLLRLYIIKRMRGRKLIKEVHILRGFRTGPISSTDDWEPLSKQLQNWSMS